MYELQIQSEEEELQELWDCHSQPVQGDSITCPQWSHDGVCCVFWHVCVSECVCESSMYQRVIRVSEGDPCIRSWSVYQRVICVSASVDWIILISVYLCVVSKHICSTNIWRQFSYDVCVMWSETGQCCVMWPARWKQKQVRTVKHKRSESYTAVLQYPVVSGHICSTP